MGVANSRCVKQQIDDSLDSEHHDIVPVKGSFSRKKLANGSDSGEEGKALASRSRYLRARRKLPLDWDNSVSASYYGNCLISVYH